MKYCSTYGEKIIPCCKLPKLLLDNIPIDEDIGEF
jgi:hypothetical protein